MPEKTEVPDPGPSSKDSTKDSGVRKVHYIVHLDRETDQIIKIEEMDEATNTTREMPLPLFLVDPEEKSGGGAAEVGATGFVFDLPVSFAAPQTPPSLAQAHLVLSTPKVDPPDPPNATAVAHLVLSTPKVDPPDAKASMPGLHTVLSTPKVDPPDPPNAMLTAHLVFQTPKVDPPDPPNAPPPDKSEGSGVKGGRVVGPCLKFRFKSE